MTANETSAKFTCTWCGQHGAGVHLFHARRLTLRVGHPWRIIPACEYCSKVSQRKEWEFRRVGA